MRLAAMPVTGSMPKCAITKGAVVTEVDNVITHMLHSAARHLRILSDILSSISFGWMYKSYRCIPWMMPRIALNES